MLELIALVAAVVVCIWTPIETRKVRGGWMRKNFKGDHAEFVAKYRRQLTVMSWIGLVLGVLNIALGLVADGTAGLVVKLVAGAIWIAAGIVSMTSRRILDLPHTT
ncbi:hypothetical protein FHP25_29980 [Vineibacter terrae]|uniref:Uncharacterized protein n=1 Tax=Vineibacter terrae TaxID=2586908 RepID=A0A5C8PD68_9HYPH|nr:hypothetical protein [Vineibacter terrae]TXL71460.1 hypothetical protein FHP25_29980 [Vineibacter terrae]